MMKELTEKEVLSRLQTLCARSEHCSHEMREKMMRWGVASDVQDKIVDRLIDDKFIDDERFARVFISDKLRFNHWGRRKIEQALFQKRIPKQISQPILNEITDQEYIEQLLPLIKSKRKSLSSVEDDYELRQRLVRFALQRGFTFDVIRQVIDGADDFDFE
ncbi:MAG: RecX family transcriptional regulator [Prevotella sp.]|jgi:regulatory protein|nr:RecX family transcriptional regulator [Prevotella sp.]MBR1621988.1 RecX family transcriptional regulator [Prevotella sp.]